MLEITSAQNALFKSLRELARDNTAYRRAGQIWLEGEHLCRAYLARGGQPVSAVFQASCDRSNWAELQAPIVVLADALWPQLSALESPAAMGFVVDVPAAVVLQSVPTVVLDGVQDSGNVGSILRCAAAFGFQQIVAMPGTAALWSPKVVRAGMGAHFALSLIETASLETVDSLRLPLLVTSSHQGEFLHQAALPHRCAWVLGHEGQGVSAALMDRATHFIRIAQPGGEESLNVAAAAAICLHASSVR